MLRHLAFLAAFALPSLAMAQVGTTPPPITINLLPPSSTPPGQTIAGISPTACPFTNGTADQCIVSVTMSPTPPQFVGSLSLVSSGGSCSGTEDTTHFGVSNSPYAITYNGSAAAGTYHVCLQAAQAGVSTAFKQITVTVGSNGSSIACDIGPNYTGTIPAAASAAGFTHCAANYDFTQISNINDWMQCPDNGGTQANNGGLALLYAADGSGHGAYPPCSDFSIINDGGTNVFDEKFTPTDYDNTTTDNVLVSSSKVNTPNENGVNFPTNVYVDEVWRWPASTVTSLGPDTANGRGVTAQGLFTFSDNQYTGAPFIEWDFTEMGNTDGFSNAIGWDGASSAFGTDFWANVPGFNATTSENYHSYGNLTEVDNSGNESMCTYFDGTALTSSCPNGSTGQSGSNLTNLQNMRNPLIIFSSGWFNDPNASPAFARPSGDIDVYWKRITVWSCANWKTTGCTVSSVATTAP